MPAFRVYETNKEYLCIEVYAETEAEAEEIAYGTDRDEWELIAIEQLDTYTEEVEDN